MIKNSFIKDQRGYTLIEIMVAIQIFFIVITLAYTIYLYSFKFMSRWNDKNSLIQSELLIRKSLTYELTHTPQILEISPKKIIYLNKQFRIKQIQWSDSSLFIKSKPLNKEGLNITIENLEFYVSQKENIIKKAFTDLDLNNDETLKGNELHRLRALGFTYLITSKRFKREYCILQSLPKVEGKDLVFDK